MKQNDTIKILQKDHTLREAVKRREQKLPPLPADLNKRVLRSLTLKPKRRVWLYPVMAIAASVLLIIGIGASLKVRKADEPTGRDEILVKAAGQKAAQRGNSTTYRPAEATAKATVPDKGVVPTCGLTSLRGSKAVSQHHRISKVAARHIATIPDTLGSGIFRSERNVVLAVQMLSECKNSIQKGEQSVRNAIVEATYHAIPQPNTTLVVCETGDYQIVEENRQAIIEI